mmetsp:Transcript_9642/g.17589  ORF Transcript_9642/g.17589 Transcript_9642/m.17589 type:complete len:254 (-) Transcript_9642:212-973(-)
MGCSSSIPTTEPGYVQPSKMTSSQATQDPSSSTYSSSPPSPPLPSSRCFQQQQFQQQQVPNAPKLNPVTDVNIIGTWEMDSGQVCKYNPNGTFLCEVPFVGTMTGRWTRRQDTVTCVVADGTTSIFQINTSKSSPGLMQIQFPNGEIHWGMKRTTKTDPYSEQQMTGQIDQALNFFSVSGQQMDQHLTGALNTMTSQTQQLNQGVNSSVQQMSSSGTYNPYMQQQQNYNNQSTSFAQSAGEFAGTFVANAFGG